ncbi:iron uptake transporter permease EfeU [Kitasatospora sp. MAP5-34]|uniref:iron uptake transporter permease EfeU n=1 Tax=Kitasatospora sp. MAP5-34 TaxID=3035102 RepID=UPI002474B620|nr:iron uptake transporter permease EfeU [Kitasatospora sp. MAP5-34]MDH6576653.1 high-affinity iron transporter [Kitasatospora sp. MAP5-34]
MWSTAFPSFLIGLREGLEAGLVVSILVATVVRSGQQAKLRQVWIGVLAAAALALSFGAVLTFTTANLSTSAQEVFGGTLSVVAVGFVTVMIFWMRRSARGLSGDLRAQVTTAMELSAGALITTAFLAVGREGLESALFLWSNMQAAGQTAGPAVGAAAGLLLSTVACWALYRRVLKINLAAFFTRTGVLLVVIAAGVLAYGLRDLQEGGVLPGNSALAVHLGAGRDAGSWYGTLLQGVFNLSPQMTWLQVVCYLGYLAVVMSFFLRRPGMPRPGRLLFSLISRSGGSASPASPPTTDPATAEAAPGKPQRRPGWAVPVALVAVPGLLACTAIVAGGGKPAATATVTVSDAKDRCGRGFSTPQPGQQTFQLHNAGGRTSEVYLIDPTTNAVYGEIEGLAPGTTRPLTATIGKGDYAWRCVPADGTPVTSAAVHVTGARDAKAVIPVSEDDLKAPLDSYRTFVQAGLATLSTQTHKLQADLHDGNLDAARADWLTAHLQYSALGAAYGTFADFDQKINGRADGLPGGVTDQDFSGFHRLEYGLWHQQSAADLTPVADQLASDVDGLAKAFPTQQFDAADLPLRTHEILENTLQFELTGDTDQGSGTNLATTQANLAGTQELLSVLAPLIEQRSPRTLTTVNAGLKHLSDLLTATHRADGSWTPVQQLDPRTRMRLNGATGQLLEDLAPIPDLLEIRKSA